MLVVAMAVCMILLSVYWYREAIEADQLRKENALLVSSNQELRKLLAKKHQRLLDYQRQQRFTAWAPSAAEDTHDEVLS